MDLTATIGLRAFTLADPYRVVVDIPQTVFQLPSKAGETGRGLIKAYRYGLVMAGGSRLVIDVTKPVRIEKATVLESRDATLASVRTHPRFPALVDAARHNATALERALGRLSEN